MTDPDDLAEARIHVLRTGNNGWSIVQTGPHVYELWGAVSPLHPNEGATVFVDRFGSEASAQQASVLLNRLWKAVAQCRRVAFGCRVSDDTETLRSRFAGVLVDLDRATNLSESDRACVSENASRSFRQLFDVLLRAAKRCTAIAVRFEREHDRRTLYGGSMRLIETTSDAIQDIRLVYDRLSRES